MTSKWSGPVWGSGAIVSVGRGLFSCRILAQGSHPEAAAGSFLSCNIPAMGRCGPHAKPSNLSPSREHHLAQPKDVCAGDERLSPSPPFSGEGAQSFIHSETRLINNVLLPARVLPLVSASLEQWENTFSRKAAVPFPSPCLIIPGRQCGPNPLYAPGGGGWSWGPVIAALLAG